MKSLLAPHTTIPGCVLKTAVHIRYLAILLLLVTFAPGCSVAMQEMQDEVSDEIPSDPYEIERHPITESIPHIDRDHIVLSRERSIAEMPDVPAPIASLSDYLQHPERYESQPLSMHLPLPVRADYVTLNTDRLLILDDLEGKLHDYDVSANESSDLTGPVLHLARRMSERDHAVRVVMEDGRVALFNCDEQPCSFREEMRIPGIRPHGITELNRLAFALIASSLESQSNMDQEEGLVRVFDDEGCQSHAFGKGYQSNVAAVRNEAAEDAMISWSAVADRYAVAFPLKPFLYLYDGGGELTTTFRVDSFTPPYFEYDPSDGTIFHPDQAASRILRISMVRDQYLALTVATTTETMEQVKLDYYLVDVATDEGYHIGSLKSAMPNWPHPVLTNHGLILIADTELGFFPF